MLHYILPSHFSNNFERSATISADSNVFCFSGNRLLLSIHENSYSIPRFDSLMQYIDKDKLVYCFKLNEESCFLYLGELNCEIAFLSFEDVYPLRFSNQKEIAWVSSVALHLKNWYNENRYCGKCGEQTQHRTDERAIGCLSCGHMVYPKISPAIIVAILSGDKILLASGVNFRSRFYSLIAGYADAGESLEEAVKREVKEEVGIDISNIRYYGSQPWPYSGSMMIGYVADADENQPLKIDEHEITDAGWFVKDALPEYPKEISIAGEMIEKFRQGKL